ARGGAPRFCTSLAEQLFHHVAECEDSNRRVRVNSGELLLRKTRQPVLVDIAFVLCRAVAVFEAPAVSLSTPVWPVAVSHIQRIADIPTLRVGAFGCFARRT